MVGRQFDIVQLGDRQLCVILQHDLLAERRTRVVVPLVSASDVVATPRLHPKLRLGRKQYVLAFDLIGAVELSEIKKVLGTAKSIEYEIVRAYDMLLGGV